MARPRKARSCRRFEGDAIWKPRSIPMTELAIVDLALDEVEAMRLCDLEGHDQAAAGQIMGVSRGTVQRLLKSGRARVLSALLANAALRIEREGDHVALRADDG